METLSRNEASSMTSEEGESKGKWLADAKRFNAQKLRIRMKEQKLRFQNTPEDKDKENQHTSSSGGAAMNQSSSRPRLAIAVSMSEDAGEPATAATPRESPFVTIQAMMEGESLDFGNASAWAMMENYDMGSKATTPDKTMSESPIVKDASAFWDDNDKSFATTTTTNNPTRSLPFSPDVRSFTTPSTITRATMTTPQILMPHHRVDEDERRPPVHTDEWNTSEQSTDERGTELLSTGPTPAKLQRQWIREKEMDSCSQSPQVSLLQESLILSESAAQDNTTIYTIPSVASEDDENSTAQLSSKVSRPPHASMATAIVQSNESRYAQMRPSALVIRPHHDAQETTDHLRLKERVLELEQALRATIATPRGTTLQENPIKTLLDRNQTLVKEVRFADSTCVELSGKVAALEAEKKILKERVVSLEDENKELRRDFSQVMMETASLARTHDDRLSVTSVVRMGHDEEAFLRQVVEELKAEVTAWTQEQTLPVASSTSTLLSDIDMNLSSNDMDVSHTLTKALQAQVELIKERKQVTRKVEAINKELLSVKARNVELENQLQQQEPSKEPSEADPSLLMDLSRAEEESNFLGRQLGNVQEKLDHTRLELDNERKKSMTIDSKWRTTTALHLRTIRALEAKLEAASHSLAWSTRSTASGHSRGVLDSQVMKVEDDILNARSTVMTFKRDLELLLSTAVFDSKWKDVSDGDTQLISIVATFVERMRKQYSTLNFQVDKAISQQCDRLDHLTDTVAFLRSSLLFETSSVSTTTSPAHPQTEITSLASSPSKSHEQGGLEFHDEEEDNDEDDMYSRMEEARENSPPAHSRHIEDISTDFDDLSRLLSDDSTLESMLKSGAAEKSLLEYESLRKPLESAIRECQRVRDRSVALKEELQAEKLALVQLESENRRLVRECSQKDEEQQLVRGALGEAKTKIQLLESCLSDQKSRNEEERLLFERKHEDLETEKARLEEWLHDITTAKDEALARVGGLQSDLDVTRDELQMAHSSLAESNEALASLKTRLGEVEGRAFEAEDLVLESRVSQEDMRKERALLKAQIAKLENQTLLQRENLERANNTSHKQIDEMSRTIKDLRAQQEESRDILRRLVIIYRNICDLFDRSENVHISSQTHGGDAPFGINWALLEQIVPFISSTLTDMDAKQSKLDSLLGELTGLQKDFMRSTELGMQYQSRIEDEKAQNQKLFELLQQAELEMERSASQIRELSVALSKQHDQENEMLSKAQEAEHKRDSVLSDMSELRRELSAEQRQSKQKITELANEISTRRNTEQELRGAIDTLESKCVRLREYVKKLTIKCEEWETSYEHQSKSLEKLQLKNARMKEKVLEVAAKYKDLSGRVKSKNRTQSENREKMAGERIDLQQIHARLEKELETITNELTAIEQK